MLSISQREKLPPKLAVKASLKKKAAESNRITDEKINKVYQDEDFIYPTLGSLFKIFKIYQCTST